MLDCRDHMAPWLRLGLQIQYILRIKRSRCVSSAARASLWRAVLLSFSEQHSPLIVGGRRDGSSLALTRADCWGSSVFSCTTGGGAALCSVSCWKVLLSSSFSRWRWHIIGASSALLSNPRPPLLCPVSEATVFCTVLEESPCSAADTRRKEMDFIFSPQNSEPESAFRLPCPESSMSLCRRIDWDNNAKISSLFWLFEHNVSVFFLRAIINFSHSSFLFPSLHRYCFIVTLSYLILCQITRVYVFDYGMYSADFTG